MTKLLREVNEFPMKLFLVAILSFIIYNDIISQTQEIKISKFKIGIEAGIGFNELEHETVYLSEILLQNGLFYLGMRLKYHAPGDFIQLSGGIRFQKKGTEEIKSDYFLVPAELELKTFSIKKLSFFLKGGTALEINTSPQSNVRYRIQRTSLNWRIGIGFSYAVTDDYTFSLQCLRTTSSNSYHKIQASPGGAHYEIDLRNSGFEIGLLLMKRI